MFCAQWLGHAMHFRWLKFSIWFDSHGFSTRWFFAYFISFKRWTNVWLSYGGVKPILSNHKSVCDIVKMCDYSMWHSSFRRCIDWPHQIQTTAVIKNPCCAQKWDYVVFIVEMSIIFKSIDRTKLKKAAIFIYLLTHLALVNYNCGAR